ncbi:MAG: diguanylate cyclase [Pseudomonas sp.]|nr:diguanylate cyclase [Pseudomonas sp.]MBB49339.1 diguanylate cyclase [Pseudomonadales bacterium]MBB50374.1 diguanylate cyclase [Pseudomonadales bacterium]MBU32222.1 diguanylate cyclase [Pseudomonadales bacterium]|tara:strand:+ start:861 stop:2486 length:1626 start_codon:yes stop_codon:yes gene_type:complete
MTDTPQLHAQLAAIEARFRQRLDDELDTLDELSAQLQNDPGALRNLRDRLHKLAGSAGTFGYGELGSVARQLEQQAQTQLDADSLDAAVLTKLSSAGAQLRPLLQRNEQREAQPQQLDAGISDDDRHRRIGLLIEEDDLASQMTQTLDSFGYQVIHLESPEALQEAAPLDALIIDTSPPGSRLLGHPVFQQAASQLPPLLIISSLDTFASRLQAVRAGAVGFFTKPVDLPLLERRLERGFNNQQGGPFRVLIVDDDAELTARYQLVLSNAGIRVDAVSDPNLLLEKMRSFIPEVVLMDLNMPEYSGPELAQVIRLDDDWLRVPIVYLSAETNAERQMSALLKAGDDFITKPISDSTLLTTVYARAQRARMVSDALARDSLTGLLKHADIKEQLEVEVERAKRCHAPVSVAMIDIDHFKNVNDTYGHACGDNVIRALSNMLRQRLRKVDRLGRYGGEEFVAVLPGCNSSDACQLLESIREAFNALQFSYGGQQFHCSFSAGISACEDDEWAEEELLERADRALYQAKQSGRNRLCRDTGAAD